MIGQSRINSKILVRNLGVWFDTNLSMYTLITKTCNTAFYYLHNIRAIRKYLTRESTETLIHAFITSRLDYCNSSQYGIPDTRISQLQRIQNACARLVCGVKKYSHITPVLFSLHWLPVKYRIQFKILLLIYLHGLSPEYITQLIIIRSQQHYNLRSHSSVNSIFLSYPHERSRVRLGDCAFQYATPVLWNSLPVLVRNASTVIKCKSLLKTHLFIVAFNGWICCIFKLWLLLYLFCYILFLFYLGYF